MTVVPKQCVLTTVHIMALVWEMISASVMLGTVEAFAAQEHARTLLTVLVIFSTTPKNQDFILVNI